MTLLLGQEAEGAGAEESITAELSRAFKFTAVATGKVTALHAKFAANGTGTSCNIAIQANEGGVTGKPVEGVLVEGVLSSNAAGAHEVAVAETELVSGTEYWITLQPQGGNTKYKPGGTTASRVDGTKHAKISETKPVEWAAESKKGPISVWATGIEGGGTEVKEVAVTIKVKTKNTAAVLQALSVGAAVRVGVRDTPGLLQSLAVAGVTKVAIRTVTQANQASSIAATTRLSVRNVAQVLQKLEVAATTRLRISDKVTVQIKQEGTRKTVIFIFED